LKGLSLLLFTHGHSDHYVQDVAVNILKTTGARIVA
jgi:L-ascorbate metabolism protein UlaG (beta-lactamase superfamily)